jgi:DNA modification methylase
VPTAAARRAKANKGNGTTPAWPADAVERRPVEALIPYAKNARLHSAAQISQIAASIKEWGWTIPVLADENGGLLAGHARVLAAQKLGFVEVPVMTARGWSEAKKRAYILADNQLTLNASWDDELLRFELGELGDLGFDLDLIGFSGLELEKLMRGSGLTDPDDVPELPEHPISQLGDLWLIGNHRLLCGDSTVEANVERLLAGVKPHLMVTDPPYGVEYDARWRQRLPYGVKNTDYIQASSDQESGWGAAHKLFPGDVAYVWHASIRAVDVALELTKLNFEIKAQLIWVKESAALKKGKGYSFAHEPCWYAVRKGKTQHWHGQAYEPTVWRINRHDGLERSSHAAQKPVECMRRPIENNSSPGQAIYEPFSGSGTTIIAAQMTGRICHAIEIMPDFIDVAVKRWQNFTGNEARLDGDGRSFDEIAAERSRLGGAKPRKAARSSAGNSLSPSVAIVNNSVTTR